MIQVYRNQSGVEFASLSLSPVEIFTASDLDGIYHGNRVTALNGAQFIVLDAHRVHGRTYKITLLPVEQEAQIV